MPRPEKELKGFERVMLQPNETQHITLDLNPRSFAFYDVPSKSWHVDAGAYKLLLGDSSAHIEDSTTVTLPEEITIPVED